VKTLQPNEVIDLLTEKVNLKRELRVAKKEKNEKLVLNLKLKIHRIEVKISGHTLSKN
jgi:hypothetical protein